MRAPAFIALGLAVSACSPVVDIGAPCSLDKPCDVGVCNLSSPDEPVCVEADGDIDGDGQPNKSDFCSQKPGGMADAFDEDGDGIGDNCDPCPIARPPAAPDSDTDAVDSPCDPDPSSGTLEKGNKIIFFDGFNNGIPANVVKREGGQWEARGGEAIFTTTDPNTTAILTVAIPLPSQHLAVQASYRVDRVEAAGTMNLAGVVSIDRRPAGVTTVSCSGTRVGGMDSLIVDSPSGTSGKPLMNLFDPGGLYKIAQLIENATGACAMTASTQMGAVTTATTGEAPTEAGLTARAVAARFQYLLIVQRPN
ncbi:MAG TPA: hypothetical protein VNO30_09190 [Kofleriaceae bacterium]|nr:hypothetical protein [Kofleriaceae bacterium]